MVLAASVALAQAPDGLQLTTVDPPRGEAATAYQDAARGRAQTQATYATDVQGGRLTVDSRAQRAAPALPRGPVLDGNIAMLVVVGGLALMLFLWLRFGGGGLFARTPATAEAPRVTPEGWDAQGSDAPGGDLLARAAAMADRRAACCMRRQPPAPGWPGPTPNAGFWPACRATLPPLAPWPNCCGARNWPITAGAMCRTPTSPPA